MLQATQKFAGFLQYYPYHGLPISSKPSIMKALMEGGWIDTERLDTPFHVVDWIFSNTGKIRDILQSMVILCRHDIDEEQSICYFYRLDIHQDAPNIERLHVPPVEVQAELIAACDWIFTYDGKKLRRLYDYIHSVINENDLWMIVNSEIIELPVKKLVKAC